MHFPQVGPEILCMLKYQLPLHIITVLQLFGFLHAIDSIFARQLEKPSLDEIFFLILHLCVRYFYIYNVFFWSL